jgi:hypothetical protein
MIVVRTAIVPTTLVVIAMVIAIIVALTGRNDARRQECHQSH